MKITPFDLLMLKHSLASLDPFKFDAKTTYTLSRNLNWVESEVKPVEATRKKIAEEYGNPKSGEPTFNDYVAKWEEFLNSLIDIKELRLVDLDDLNIGNKEDENSIPVRVLNGLFPIIKDEPDTKKVKK